MNVRARHGASYFITFIDDYTRYVHVYLISLKFQALDCFIQYINEVENQLDRKIKALSTDRGREYLSEQFEKLCNDKGILRQLTTPRTLQQNGVAERRNRTLLEMVRSMMAQANPPIQYWGDALMTAAYILNRVSRKSVSSTPYELWTGRKPDLNWPHPWGSAAYIHDTSHKYGKLGPRGKKFIFIRYYSKGFVFIGEDFCGRITEIESRDVTFLEDQFLVKDDVDKSHHLYEIDEQGNVGTSHQFDDIPTIVTNPVSANRSTKELLQPSQLSGRFEIENEPILIGRSNDDSQLQRSIRSKTPRKHFQIENEAYIATPQDDDEPEIIKEALEYPTKEKWKVALEEEIESMKVNQVWSLVDLPPGQKAIGNKWILKIKRKTDGSIDRYKAHLVAIPKKKVSTTRKLFHLLYGLPLFDYFYL